MSKLTLQKANAIIEHALKKAREMKYTPLAVVVLAYQVTPAGPSQPDVDKTVERQPRTGDRHRKSQTSSCFGSNHRSSDTTTVTLSGTEAICECRNGWSGAGWSGWSWSCCPVRDSRSYWPASAVSFR